MRARLPILLLLMSARLADLLWNGLGSALSDKALGGAW
jgi:hypothetical protein